MVTIERIYGYMVALALLGGGELRALERIDYARDVKPILAAHCYVCHGALRQRSELRLDTAALAREGGKRGPAVVAGNSAGSLLIKHITASNGARRMPPESEGEPLKPQEIARIKAWIDQGAVAPADEKPEADPRAHWAFRTPARPPVPRAKDSHPARNPVDAFLGAGREQRGLVAQPPADRRILLRRLSLDLIGLPPTRAESAAFVADSAPGAYERVVDRLLASKEYAERWGRHWMDIWRYSDWWGLGAEVRNSQKHIWHWRDWIVESLNADKGYDQMLREMLAADELYPNDLNRLRATGFLVRSYFKFNRTTWLDDTVEHMSKGFLGLTMNCAKCHDHKYDPITQADYYRMRAFFEPYQIRTDELPGEVDLEKDGLPRAFDCNLHTPTYLFVRGDEKRPMTSKPLTPGVPALLALGEFQVQPVNLPAEAQAPGLRPFVLEDHLRAARHAITESQNALRVAREKLAQLEHTGTSPPPMTAHVEAARAEVSLAEKALAARETQPAALGARAAADRARYQQPPTANARELARLAAQAERQETVATGEESLARAELEVLRAADAGKTAATKKRDAARSALAQARKTLASKGDTYTSLRGSLKALESNLETEDSRSNPYPAVSTGRRSALARWLTDPRHPLTARVAVNHIWTRHFGRPLVATVFDFGRKGTPPTHQALLDYLAVELREHQWSMKHLHRLLVTSDAYRMQSSSATASAANLAADPENRYYWRMNPVRMEAEVVRDSLLHLAGELDRTQGGPPLDAENAVQSRRRSLYLVHSHNDHHKFLLLFDGANVLECYRRAESIVPQQALALSNSKMALQAAARIAARLNEQPGTEPDDGFIRAAFETILGCQAGPEEEVACRQALARWRAILATGPKPGAPQRARADLVQALVNHNDFITVR